jgi:hypothetical protein
VLRLSGLERTPPSPWRGGGAALLQHGLQKGWFITTAGFREVTITPAGWRALHLHFQLAERSSRMIN